MITLEITITSLIAGKNALSWKPTRARARAYTGQTKWEYSKKVLQLIVLKIKQPFQFIA